MVGLLRTAEGVALYPRFQDRVSRLASIASDVLLSVGIGWGYGDHVTEQIELLEADVSEQWEHWAEEGRVPAD